MTLPHDSRYRLVSRRAMLKASLGAGVAITTAACGANDADVFAGAVADLEPTTTTTTTTTTTAAPTTSEAASSDQATEPTTTESTNTDDTDAVSADDSTNPAAGVAVLGEMVISATYTWGPEGKIESPYVAVWVENEAGELLETVALFYEQGRRGARWLDHLDRWFTADAQRIASGGTDVAATISSATRPPGEYAVVWDGTINGAPAPAGTYSIYVEAAREEGPVSLTNTTVALDGSLAPTTLPDNGELSLVSVRIDG